MIASCEEFSEDAEIPFDNILERLTGSDPSVTDYVLVLLRRRISRTPIKAKVLADGQTS